MDNASKRLKRTYELTFIVPGTYTDAELAPVKAEVEQLLKKHKAEKVEVIDWGKKPLAYVMTHEGKKHRDGYYTHIIFDMETLRAQDFEHDIFLVAKVMRHLLLVAEEKKEEKKETTKTA